MSETEKDFNLENVWVLGYDKETGERVDFYYGPRWTVYAQTLLFEDRGLRVEVVEEDEMDRRTGMGAYTPKA